MIPERAPRWKSLLTELEIGIWDLQLDLHQIFPDDNAPVEVLPDAF